MCGIVGSIYREHGNLKKRKENFLTMLQTIAHRGPNGSYCWNDESCYLGFDHLAIIGGREASQPLHNENKDIQLICNGEIYNYQEITKQLSQRGHLFTSKSDCEVIIHLYEEKGVNCLQDLKGQFAFTLWDQKKNIAFAARDRFGICPFFYKIDKKSFLFASEIKAILTNKTIKAELDLQGLAETAIFYGSVPPRTCFRYIKQLPPGSYLLIDIKNWKHSRKTYWELNFSHGKQSKGTRIITAKEISERFKQLLIESVKKRLQGNFAPGLYLSGGIDSSTISVICSHLHPESTVFSLQFTNKRFDESKFQHLLKNQIGFRHKSITVSVKDIYGNLIPVVWHAEVPLTRTAPVPMMLLSRLVRQNGYKCVLTGEGADELLAGYPVFAKGKSSIENKYYLNRSILKLFKEDFFLEEKTALTFKRLLENKTRNLQQLQELEVKTKLSQYLLHSQGERMAMANGVELRFPYLDEDLVAFIERLHPRYYFRNKEGKYLLRQIMQDKLSKEIIYRKKQGYLAPSGFNQCSLPEYVQELMSDSMIKKVDLFRPKLVKEIVKNENNNHKLAEIAFLFILTTHILYWLFVEKDRCLFYNTISPPAE